MKNSVDKVYNNPELGIYDARDWDAQYTKWTHGIGDAPEPGKHPDPNCIWNQDKKAYDHYVYEQQKRKKIEQALSNGLI